MHLYPDKSPTQYTGISQMYCFRPDLLDNHVSLIHFKSQLLPLVGNLSWWSPIVNFLSYIAGEDCILLSSEHSVCGTTIFTNKSIKELEVCFSCKKAHTVIITL